MIGPVADELAIGGESHADESRRERDQIGVHRKPDGLHAAELLNPAILTLGDVGQHDVDIGFDDGRFPIGREPDEIEVGGEHGFVKFLAAKNIATHLSSNYLLGWRRIDHKQAASDRLDIEHDQRVGAGRHSAEQGAEAGRLLGCLTWSDGRENQQQGERHNQGWKQFFDT